jgi:hypothetical protein
MSAQLIVSSLKPHCRELAANNLKGISMNILLIYPQSPDTFWSFEHSLKFIAKKQLPSLLTGFK